MIDLGPHPYRYSLSERIGFAVLVAIVAVLAISVGSILWRML